MNDTDTTSGSSEPEIVIVPLDSPVDYDWFGPADHDDNPISRLVDDHEYNGLGRIANLIQ